MSITGEKVTQGNTVKLMPVAEEARSRGGVLQHGRPRWSQGQLGSIPQRPSTGPQGLLYLKSDRKWDPSHKLRGARALGRMRKYRIEKLCLVGKQLSCFQRSFCRQVKEIKCDWCFYFLCRLPQDGETATSLCEFTGTVPWQCM